LLSAYLAAENKKAEQVFLFRQIVYTVCAIPERAKKVKSKATRKPAIEAYMRYVD
jgi:hypothetical protein